MGLKFPQGKAALKLDSPQGRADRLVLMAGGDWPTGTS